MAQVACTRRVLLRGFLGWNARPELRNAGGVGGDAESRGVLAEGYARRRISLRCNSIPGGGRQPATAHTRDARRVAAVRQRHSQRGTGLIYDWRDVRRVAANSGDVLPRPAGCVLRVWRGERDNASRAHWGRGAVQQSDMGCQRNFSRRSLVAVSHQSRSAACHDRARRRCRQSKNCRQRDADAAWHAVHLLRRRDRHDRHEARRNDPHADAVECWSKWGIHKHYTVGKSAGRLDDEKRRCAGS